MLKALIWKELRELLPICLIALAVQLIFASIGIAQWRTRHMQSDIYVVWPFFWIVSFLFPICAGLWQNWRETSQNTFQFLLQRPVNRHVLFGLKLTFGAIVCLMVVLAPMAWFAAWVKLDLRLSSAEIPQWFWGFCGGIWLLYTGAFLSSLRTGRWYGSRFLPLLAGVFLFFLLEYVYESLSRTSSGLGPISLLIGPLLSIGFIVAALYVGRTQDYSS